MHSTRTETHRHTQPERRGDVGFLVRIAVAIVARCKTLRAACFQCNLILFSSILHLRTDRPKNPIYARYEPAAVMGCTRQK